MDDFWDSIDEAKFTPDAILKNLSSIVNELKHKKSQVELAEMNLKNLKEEVRVLEQIKIPLMLQQAGVKEVTAEGVGKVSYTQEFRADVSAENWEHFKSWATVNGYQDLIKENTVIENATKEQQQAIIDHGGMFTTSSGIHWRTLSTLAKNLAAEGKHAPPCMSVFSYYQTKIKA